MILDKNAPTSPLRFPGSKSRVIKKLIPFLDIKHFEYREPFLGGGSIFLTKKKAQNNWLNDKDRNLSLLWKVIKNNPQELCEKIDNNYPTIELWHEIKSTNYSNELDLAFKYFFLNRTNFSGIIGANPIGGLNQNSKYPIDCRWNPSSLKKRILACSKKLQNVKITSYDYKKLIKQDGDNVFLVLDPPYYKKGKDLYPVYMTPKEHEKLATLLKETEHKFFLTIDNCSETKELYSWANFLSHKQWFYTISSKKIKKGKELFITNFDIEKENSNSQKVINI